MRVSPSSVLSRNERLEVPLLDGDGYDVNVRPEAADFFHSHVRRSK